MSEGQEAGTFRQEEEVSMGNKCGQGRRRVATPYLRMEWREGDSLQAKIKHLIDEATTKIQEAAQALRLDSGTDTASATLPEQEGATLAPPTPTSATELHL